MEMKKLDDSNTDEGYMPLLSQNVSVIEVGAYSHIFATFLGFLGIKTLIITDLDCANKPAGKAQKSRFSDATITTNASIKYFMGTDNLQTLISTSEGQRAFCYDPELSVWNANQDGMLKLAFQNEENMYHARSFEDAFICKNKKFISDNKGRFISLKNRDMLNEENNDYYEIAEKCIASKTSFALDILLYGGENGEQWEVPQYIREGLSWLAQ